jgi:hypothetical protein
MKTRYILPLLAVLSAGCMPVDSEASLYQIVQSDRRHAYTIYNYPSIYLTTGEQKARARKQAESVRDFVRTGMSESQLTAIWGRPNDIKKSINPSGIFDKFIYNSRRGEHYYFIFRDKKLESWYKI